MAMISYTHTHTHSYTVFYTMTGGVYALLMCIINRMIHINPVSCTNPITHVLTTVSLFDLSWKHLSISLINTVLK